MKTYPLENGKFVGIAYYTNVTNIRWLKENALSIFQEKTPVLINPKLIVDPFQIVVATNNACMAGKDTMKTRSCATEILHNLSFSYKISQSLKDVSVSDNDTDMIVAIVSKFENVPEMVIFEKKCIEGVETDLLEALKNVDKNHVKAYYKITKAELRHSTLLESIVTRIACKPLD